MTPLAALALSGALLTANPPEAQLPPNHPPIPSKAPAAAGTGGLPANHPPLGSAAEAVPTGAMPNGHPPVAQGNAAPSAEELIKQLDATPNVREGDKPFEIAATLGHLYASNARYDDAIAFFRQAEKKAAPLRTYFLSLRGSAKGALPVVKECPTSEPIENQVEALKGLAADRRASCALTALVPAMEATARRGNLHVLVGDAKSAMAAWDSVLELNPEHPDALYGRGALVLDTQGDDVAALKKAKSALEGMVARHPMHPRTPQAHRLIRTAEEAITAGGMTKRAALRAEDRKVRLSKGIPKSTAVAAAPPMMGGQGSGKPASNEPNITPQMMEAVQNTEMTPELVAGMAKLVEEGEVHLAKGQYDQALGAYRRVVPFQPDNARARAGMAWALVKLDKQPMADRVWGVAASDPKSIDSLGDTLKAKGDSAGAKAVWLKLSQSRPDYAANLKVKLQ